MNLSTIKSLFDFSFATRCITDAKKYHLPPSISSNFSWESYDNDKRMMQFADGKSCGVVYELSGLSTEGQSLEYVDSIRDSMSQLISDIFPRYDEDKSPWVISFYLNDEVGLDEGFNHLKSYVHKRANDKPYSKLYLNWWKRHCDIASSKEGMFVDPNTNLTAKGCVRKVRFVAYRNITKKSDFRSARDASEELEQVCVGLETHFRNNKINYLKYDEQGFYKWMTRWLSPKPAGYKSDYDYVSKNSLPADHEKSIGFDLTQSVFNATPVSDDKTGVWRFDGVLHKFIPILGFKRLPRSGLLTAELKQGLGANSGFSAAFDKFPEGSVFVLTSVLVNEQQLSTRIERIENRAKKSITTEAEMAVREASTIKEMIVDKNFIFPTTMGLYIKDSDASSLSRTSALAMQLLSSLGLCPLDASQDLVGVDSYLRFLPFNYNYQYDKRYLFRHKLASLKQIASIVPVYGRTRGSGHCGYTAFNRQMEMVNFDLIKDKVNNAHALIFGTTGSGKSAFVLSMLAQAMAMYCPRLVMVDAGASLRHIVNLWKEMGYSTNIIDIQMTKPKYSLNPFSETEALRNQLKHMARLKQSLEDYDTNLNEKLNELTSNVNEHDLADDIGERDYLIDFVAAAILMITGADKKEMDNLTRQDRYFILEGIKKATQLSQEKGFEEMIPSDLVDAFTVLSNEAHQEKGAGSEQVAITYQTLRNNLSTFIDSPLNALYFNVRGNKLPEADITWLELGVLKDDRAENEAPRALVFISLMNKTMTLAEKHKDSGRPTIFFGDECHIVTNKPITAASIVQCAKMSRKVNLWIWLATQNVGDFPAEAKKIVSMMEYLFVLYCDVKEREEIMRFRDLTVEQQQLIGTLQKEKGKYMENVLICNRGNYLFRNIPPREVLALAGTDGDENSLRAQLQKEYDCNQMEASLLMAQSYRGEEYDIKQVREEICIAKS